MLAECPKPALAIDAAGGRRIVLADPACAGTVWFDDVRIEALAP